VRRVACPAAPTFFPAWPCALVPHSPLMRVENNRSDWTLVSQKGFILTPSCRPISSKSPLIVGRSVSRAPHALRHKEDADNHLESLYLSRRLSWSSSTVHFLLSGFSIRQTPQVRKEAAYFSKRPLVDPLRSGIRISLFFPLTSLFDPTNNTPLFTLCEWDCPMKARGLFRQSNLRIPTFYSSPAPMKFGQSKVLRTS